MSASGETEDTAPTEEEARGAPPALDSAGSSSAAEETAPAETPTAESPAAADLEPTSGEAAATATIEETAAAEEAPAGIPPVLDPAHVGDIRGALGTIRQHDMPPHRPRRRQLLALLAIMGPGLIVMVGDNDAGGVSTYSQAGQNYGTSLLWVLLLLVPVLIVNQEMVVRLGAVTGVGHARLIFERFGRFWGMFSVGDLFLLNFLTIVTEFIGVDLALGYLGLNKYVSVPLAAVGLVAMTVTGSFRRWERAMYVFIVGNFLVIPLIVYSHPQGRSLAHDFFMPQIAGGVNSTAVLLIVAIVGTTVAPWQLFFQQSNIIDKRITPRWINYERADTVIGSVIVVVGAAAMMIATAFAFAGTAAYGHYTDARGVAVGFEHYIGSAAGTIYAIVLLNASFIGAAAVTLSTSYAFGDSFGTHHSLHRSWREQKFFYATFSGLVGLAAVIVLIPGAPLGVITTSVQALAGVLLPSATAFLVLLCNDRQVLGPWVNRPWLNAVATAIVGGLLMLSAILVITTLFPTINVTLTLLVLGGILLVGLVVYGVVSLREAGTRPPPPTYRVAREMWTMPPLALLEKPEWSRSRMLAMSAMRAYLAIAVILLLIKAIRLGTGH